MNTDLGRPYVWKSNDIYKCFILSALILEVTILDMLESIDGKEMVKER